ncbi:23S rRNA pseudouridine(1911/1915/1917) synthase RluD [Zymobacter sp. IVIA_12111.31 C1]|uniref:23S rRNA pseudouridine(1911/1915/1917) synthase RluD n=1 Tax=Zymobacter sp. IVIA_12111.31 C1 TaxID=3394854 RepID=UPI0039C0CE44
MTEPTAEIIEREAQLTREEHGMRMDQAAAVLFSEFSRERLKQWIGEGALTLDGKTVKPKVKVLVGQWLRLKATLQAEGDWVAQDIPLDVVYEDDSVLVINKPAGLVVHPAAGNPDGTLLNALLHHYPAQENIPRAGIVHRLDKDTTGLMVVARTLEAHHSLINQLKDKSVTREYDAVVVGVMTAGGTVDAPLGRHPKDRKRQAVVSNGKPAVTHFRVVERFAGHTHIRCQLETGRTHQIRVHMSHEGWPLVGDPVYGGRLRFPKGASETLRDALKDFSRQALHARRLRFEHPVTGEEVMCHAPLPDDMVQLLDCLREE